MWMKKHHCKSPREELVQHEAFSKQQLAPLAEELATSPLFCFFIVNNSCVVFNTSLSCNLVTQAGLRLMDCHGPPQLHLYLGSPHPDLGIWGCSLRLVFMLDIWYWVQARGSAPPVSDGRWQPGWDQGEASRVSSASQGPLYLRSIIEDLYVSCSPPRSVSYCLGLDKLGLEEEQEEEAMSWSSTCSNENMEDFDEWERCKSAPLPRTLKPLGRVISSRRPKTGGALISSKR